MLADQITLRAASPDDARPMAELINFAGEGMPYHLWGRMADPGETAWEVGQRRARRDEGGFSWRNTTVAETGGRVVACLIGYPLPEDPEPIDPASMPAMFVPLQELENLAPGSWYVNVLATYPEFRGRGIGSILLEEAGHKAREATCTGLSIIVSDANTGARRLYERSGYVERATRPMVKGDWESAGQNWVLLAK